MRIIKIAIVNQNLHVLEDTKKKINDIVKLKYKHLDIAISAYESEVLFLEIHLNYDIVILDYNLKYINGVQVANALKYNNCNSNIIFWNEPIEILIFQLEQFIENFSSDKRITIQCFKVVKDLDLNKAKNFYFYETINTKHLIKIEANQKETYIFLSDDTQLTTKKSLKSWATLLSGNEFVYVNKGAIINLFYVLKTQRRKVILTNDETMYLGDTYTRNLNIKLKLFRLRGF